RSVLRAAGGRAEEVPSRERGAGIQARRSDLMPQPVGSFSLERKHALPVLFHVDDGPLLRRRLVERLVEPADRRLPVVGPLAFAVGVMDETREASSAAARRPLEHLLIAVGVAEGEDRPAADELVDADG